MTGCRSRLRETVLPVHPQKLLEHLLHPLAKTQISQTPAASAGPKFNSGDSSFTQRSCNALLSLTFSRCLHVRVRGCCDATECSATKVQRVWLVPSYEEELLPRLLGQHRQNGLEQRRDTGPATHDSSKLPSSEPTSQSAHPKELSGGTWASSDPKRN